MNTSDQFKPTESFGLLLVGAPKTFKTTMLLQFPQPGIIDIDNNLGGSVRFLKGQNKLGEFRYSTILQEEPEPAKQWTKLTEEIKLLVKDPWVKTIAIDGLSGLSDCLINHIVANKPKDRDAGMTISDWVPYRNLMTKIVMALRGTKKLLVMTAHEEYNKDERTGQILTTVNMPSKLAFNFGGFFSDVWRSEAEEVNGSYRHVIKAMPLPGQPGIGNSLGLPKSFVFSWEEVQKKLGSIV